MRALLVVAAVFLAHVDARAIPACASKVKQELSRQSLDWKRSETEKVDSSAMSDEYHEQQDLMSQIEGTIPNPPRPKREKFKDSFSYKKAMTEWRELNKQAAESRARILNEKRPDYKSASVIVEKYKAPHFDFFYDYVRSGLADYDQVLYFPNKAKAKVTAYVQNGRIQGYRSVQASGDRDVVLLDGDCGIDALTIHHSKLTDLVRISLCDDLGKLKTLVARAAANPSANEDDEEETVQDSCKEQGGEWDGERCRCPGMSKSKAILAEIDPTIDTCFEERNLSDTQRLSEYAVSMESVVEPSLESYASAERVCQRYYGVSVKALSSPGAEKPAASHK